MDQLFSWSNFIFKYLCFKAATNDDLNMLISLLESPILKSIATLQDSVEMLATQVAHHPSILPGDFDITPAGKVTMIQLSDL